MTAEKTSKTTATKEGKGKNETRDMVIEKISEGIVEIEKYVKMAKEKYEKTSKEDKHKMLIGVAGAATLLGTIIGINSLKKKK